MEELKQEFTKETVDFASKWCRKTGKDYIAKYPEIALNMSEEKIAAMKSRVNELVKNAEKIVNEEFSNPVLWWHLEPHLHDSISRYQQVADKYPEVLDTAVRHVLGWLGVVLEDFGFRITARGNTGTFHEFWFDRQVDTGKTVPCYPHLISWTQEMQDTVREYNAQYVKVMKIYSEIQELKEEKRRRAALTRWDSVKKYYPCLFFEAYCRVPHYAGGVACYVAAVMVV